jgi:tetratricopeptide (TPR) repeat protein
MRMGRIGPELCLALVFLLPTTAALDCSDPEEAGRALQAEGNWDAAAQAFERALQECGEDAGVFNSLGQALWQTGNPDAALVNFKKAVGMDPQNPFMVYNLGSLLHWEGHDLTAAEIALEKAVQLSDEQGGNEMLSRHAARARERCRSAAAMRINRERIALEKVRKPLRSSPVYVGARLISHGLTATNCMCKGEESIEEVKSIRATPWQDKVAQEASGDLSKEEFFTLVGPGRY